jgi:putative transposase
VPESVYVDNGSAFVDSWLLRACARLGIKLTHSTPGRPQGRGKIERFFRTVREQFLVEIDEDAITDLAQLNRYFTAWVETVYHTTTHSETGQTPLSRWNHGVPDPLPRPSAAQLHEAFLWSEHRTVTKTATVSLLGNIYQVDPILVGRKIELVFDPFDLSRIEARHQGHSFGPAAAFTLGRHSHPKARPETGEPDAVTPTGINYLHLLDAVHDGQLGARINYAALTGTDPDTGESAAAAESTQQGGHPAHAGEEEQSR